MIFVLGTEYFTSFSYVIAVPESKGTCKERLVSCRCFLLGSINQSRIAYTSRENEIAEANTHSSDKDNTTLLCEYASNTIFRLQHDCSPVRCTMSTFVPPIVV